MWRDRAACLGMDTAVFFPNIDARTRNRPNPERVAAACAAAVAICRRCPVRTDCLAHALEVGETEGVWGGTDPVERRKLAPTRKLCARCGESFPLSGSAIYCPPCRPAAYAEYPSHRRDGWPGFPMPGRVSVEWGRVNAVDDPRSRAADAAYQEGEL